MAKEKVARYTRVSTREQASDGFGLDAQNTRLGLYCDFKGYDTYRTYCDAGISGKDTKDRKEFNKMLSDMKAGKFTKIIALKLDRISRSARDFLEFFDTIKKCGCELEFADGPDITGSSGMLLVTILSGVAQWEREIIVERTTDGMEEAAYSGHFGGKPPLGYMKETINGIKGKKWVINEEEAKVVREIFTLCLKGKSYFQIAKIIKEKYSNMISSIKENEETGEKVIKYRKWNDGVIGVILNNKNYIGIREYRKRIIDKEIIEIKDQIPAIITEEIFNECRDNIRKNSRNYYRSKNYLFTQKLICPRCGRIMACRGSTNRHGKEYLYYQCKDCKTNFREDYVEKTLIKELTTVLELYLILENSYVFIDNETATELSKGKIDNTIRYAMDTITINKKLNKSFNYDLLSQIWHLTSYETKCTFIYEYIDTIKIKKHKKNGKEIIEILDLAFRKHKVADFKAMFDKNMIDTLVDNGQHECSIAEFNSRKQADDYIEILKKKYNIKVYDKDNYYFSDNLFKMISIKSNRAVEKDDVLFLEIVV